MTPYYEDDAVTIYHGDALEVMEGFRTGSFDGVVTDPPYIIGAVSSGSMEKKSGGWADMMNSALWFATWYAEAWRCLRHHGAMWSFLNWRTLPVVMKATMTARVSLTSMLVWDKEWIGPGGHQGLRPSYELVALMAKDGFVIPDRGTPDIARCKVGSYKEHGHPAEKPENIIHHILKVSAFQPGALILDPFLGSGTTAKVAKDLGLRAIGIEADERYCEIAAKRMGQGALPL